MTDTVLLLTPDQVGDLGTTIVGDVIEQLVQLNPGREELIALQQKCADGTRARQTWLNGDKPATSYDMAKLAWSGVYDTAINMYGWHDENEPYPIDALIEACAAIVASLAWQRSIKNCGHDRNYTNVPGAYHQYLGETFLWLKKCHQERLLDTLRQQLSMTPTQMAVMLTLLGDGRELNATIEHAKAAAG